MDKLEKILRKYLENGSDTIDVTMVLALIQQCKKDIKKLTLTDVTQQRELLENYQHFIDWNEEHDRKASKSERIESFIAYNCGQRT
jgi:hypothetical protein